MPLSLWTVSFKKHRECFSLIFEKLKNRSRLITDGLSSVGQVALTEHKVIMAKITRFTVNCDADEVSKFVLVVFI